MASHNDSSQSSMIRIKNLPGDISRSSVEQLVASFGAVVKMDPSENGLIVAFESPTMATRARESLNHYDMNGYQLEVDYVPLVGAKMMNGRGGNKPRYPYTLNHAQPNNNRNRSGLPLRILVPSELVGAIIGKKGATIRSITTQHKARVDVHGKENSGLLEKIISIYGQPENCSNACREIMNVMQKEAEAGNKGMIVLKMLADDRYCGRIIGKEGKIIKKVKEDTETRITVSNTQEMAALYPDRVICIKGGIDNMVKAQSLITQRLTECIERDFSTTNNDPTAPNPMMNPNMPMGSYPPVAPLAPYNARRAPYNGGMGNMNGPPNIYQGMYGAHPEGPQLVEMCQISVPNSIVGAIIGAGGSIIKQIMQDSNAHVTVEARKEEEGTNGTTIERTVTIRGTADACWKSSYFIFEKVKGEGVLGSDDRLKTVIKIPKAMVGRVIGRSGKNVREIQRLTGASIKLPEDPETQTNDVVVEVYGNFMATQGAHNRIRALISQTNQFGAPSNGPIGPRNSKRTQSYNSPVEAK